MLLYITWLWQCCLVGLQVAWPDCAERTLAVRADRRTWHGLTDRSGNRFLAATGEQPLCDQAWDALLLRWDGYAVLLHPPEHVQPAGDAREAAAAAPDARAFKAVSKSLWFASPSVP